MERWSVRFWLTVSAVALLFPPISHAEGPPPDRITHYAVIVTGPAFNPSLNSKYWAVNRNAREMLNAYGYPKEAVYCLCEQGPTRGSGVDGCSTVVNVRKVFGHLAKVMKDGDQLFILLVGHGAPSGKDFVYVLNDGRITATELNTLVDRLPTQHITIAMSPCFSGGFIPKLSRPGRVICTSTNDAEENATPWAEAFTEALMPSKSAELSKQRISIKQAYDSALDATVKRYNGNTREHPLLDDNGDGVGHFGRGTLVGGDGKLAAQRFLGAEGRKLAFSAGAIEKLRELNAPLSLIDLSRLQRVFAAEGVYLGTLGGYEKDVGANSTRTDDHLAWARRQSAHVVADNLVNKYVIQFDRQARVGRGAAERFYADASARMAAYGVDLGNPGANLKDSGAHLNWAKGQALSKLRQELEVKVRTLLAGVSNPAVKE